MTVHSLCLEPHPILRMAARLVNFETDDMRPLARSLIETMHANNGIGLAAPQIGRDVQVFVTNPSQVRGAELVVVNPVIVSMRGRASVNEGCLSLPNIWERITRAAHIHMRGHDVSGNPLDLHADGLLAIVLQHECDHLQGRLFIDRVSRLRRRRVGRKVRAAACA